MINREYYEQLEGAIAVIGMSGAFAGAKDIDEYWKNLIEGKECIEDISDDEMLQEGVPEDLLRNKNYVKRAASLSSAKEFDPGFFGYTAAEAKLMDPQHRLFLEHSWKCLEDGNVIPAEYDGLIGVYGGCSQNNYLLKNVLLNDISDKSGAFQTMIHNDKDYLTTKVSYKLNLKGPSITMQTACSTSLTAIQQGCLSLLNYQSDMALCGGVSVNVPHRGGYLYQKGLILSPKGHCRAFDKDADGTVFGDGVGVVLLKRLEEAIEDNDNIYAVIRGSAINNDGSEKVGYTAPSVKTQAEVIATAQAIAEVSPDSIGYIEAHGTGTNMGDPIELAALTDAFKMKTDRTGYCYIGSVKPNIGHLDAAAGVASFIKTVLVVSKGIIPPQINYDTPNPALNLKDSPFLISKEQKEWVSEKMPRRAGQTSLGVGGTNVHLIVEEYIAPIQKETSFCEKAQLMPFSAKSQEAITNLGQTMGIFSNDLSQDPQSVAFTLQKKRVAFPYRNFLIYQGKDMDYSQAILKAPRNPAQENPKVAFLFTGQGSQYPQMGRGLYEKIPYIRNIMDDCFSYLLAERDLNLKAIMYPEASSREESEDKLKQTSYTQPSLFILEYALASYFRELGLEPIALLGHSLGEYTAACISGVFTLKDALCLVADRGRIMQGAPEGAMLSIPLSKDKIIERLDSPELQLSVINAPERCVVSGTKETISLFKDKLDKEGIKNTLLKTSHAYHSFMMDSILEEFSRCFTNVNWGQPIIPVISNLTGSILELEKIANKDYWVYQLRETVNFEAGISVLLDDKDLSLIEIGPGNTLTTLSKLHPLMGRERSCLPSIRSPRQSSDDYPFLLQSLGKMWQTGFSIKWETLYDKIPKHFSRVPSYQFERREYWVEGQNRQFKKQSNLEAQEDYKENKPLDVKTEVTRTWLDLFGLDTINEDDNFYDLGGHSVLAVQLLAQINDLFDLELGLGTLLMEPTLANSIKVVDRAVKKAIKSEKEEISLTEKVLPMMFPVQKGHKDKTPLFMVSGLYSNRYYESEEEGLRKWQEDYFRYFSTLVRNIGADQPIYGFRPKGIFLHEESHKDVQEMAKAYIEAIKTVQPQGPYFIGGECVGGIIAYEIAQQLNAMGDEVRHLILMDTAFPSGRALLIDSVKILKRRIVEEISYPLKADGIRRVVKLRNLLSILFNSIIPLSGKQKDLRRVRYGDVIFLRKLRKYRPEINNKIPIVNIANQEWLDGHTHLEWPRNFDNTIKFIPIPGTHLSRLTDHGHITGEHIRKILED